MIKDGHVYYYGTNDGGDEQYTPRKTVELLLPWIKHLKGKTIWCPFDKADSQFVKVLGGAGFNVVYSHIDYGQDFFEYEPEHWDVIISNPPYKGKRKFYEHALELGKPFAMLLPVTILSDGVINQTMKGREKEFQLLLPSRRTRFYNGITGEMGKTPTFKAAYFGVGLFEQQIILADLEPEQNG